MNCKCCWYLSLTLFISFFASCEKDIDIDLKESEPRLVVDGSIENGANPVVVLNKSLDYFGTITTDLLLSSFVRNATVTIKEGNNVFRLREDSIPLTTGAFYYFYRTDSLTGKLNTSYTLNITAEGRSYSATTTIPQITRKIDSLWAEKAPIKDTVLFRMMIRATDKPGFGDYIRYFTKTNADPFFPGFNSVFDDQVIDGKTYTIQVDRGINKNVDNNDTDIYYNPGDTATLKLCNIDRITYDFWRTFEFSFQSIGNPFSSPTKILSNISNGGLGYFGGYAAQYRTVVMPK
ncbi:MAG TPA: DUF4249 domain-containing protein [Chitinophagaceae bacterium]|nr:DUF4249 domain-containing protein [Chitinophagaceae bacterium]